MFRPAFLQEALKPFSNPLLLGQMRPQLEAAFGRLENGASLLQTLYANVRTALLHGIQLVFLSSAIVMMLARLTVPQHTAAKHSHVPPRNH